MSIFYVYSSILSSCELMTSPLFILFILFTLYYSVALMKIDLLDSFDEIKIGVIYKHNGKVLDSFPGILWPSHLNFKFPFLPDCDNCTATTSELANVEVEYLTMPGWKSKTAHIRTFSQFPQNAQAYVRKIEELIGVPSEF